MDGRRFLSLAIGRSRSRVLLVCVAAAALAASPRSKGKGGAGQAEVDWWKQVPVSEALAGGAGQAPSATAAVTPAVGRRGCGGPRGSYRRRGRARTGRYSGSGFGRRSSLPPSSGSGSEAAVVLPLLVGAASACPLPRALAAHRHCLGLSPAVVTSPSLRPHTTT